MSIGREILKSIGVFGEVVVLQSVKQWFECMNNTVQVNRVDYLTLTVGSFSNNTVRSEFIQSLENLARSMSW